MEKTAWKTIWRSLITALLLPMALAACAGQEAETPTQKVFAIQSDYAAAQTAALAYVESDQADPVVAHAIRLADRMAMDAVTAAREAVRQDAEDPRAAALNAVARRAVLHLYELVPIGTRAPPGAG